MSLKDKNIEELFRSGLEDAELPVNDAMWSNISKGMSQTVAGSTATAATGMTAKMLTYIGLSGAACAIGVAATLFFADNNEVIAPVNNSVEEISNNEVELSANSTDLTINETPTEDNEIVNQIVANETIQDPIITKEQKKDAKKVVTVTEKDKQYYKGNSWVNDYLTPKSKAYTEPSTTIIANNEVKKVDAKPVVETIKPTISAVENNVIIASIVAMPIGGYAPLEVSFAHHSEKGTAHWDFGDGTESDNNSASHTFEKFGKYTVTLTVKDDQGKEFKDYKVIEVLANSAITKIPNVFTPNNDGANDYFMVEGKNIEGFSLTVLNVQGNIIYQSSDINEKWDGKDKYGEEAASGTYVLVISAKGIDGKKYEHSGTVTLKR